MSVRLSKIYTKTGDDGTTGVIGGRRFSKSSILIEAYGTCDELNSHLGLLRVTLAHYDNLSDAQALLTSIQNRLFDWGAIMATPPDEPTLSQRLSKMTESDENVRLLEKWIDEWNEELPKSTTFVLPGSNLANAQAHVARTVCRRLERVLVRRNEKFPIEPATIAYFNRLSDFLFTFARWLTWKIGDREVVWRKGEDE